MIKFSNFTALLALSSIAVLPACSMFGGGNSNHAGYVSPLSPALSQNTIAQVQTRLRQAGDYNGAIDGLWGPATETGIHSYQQQHSLNATGQLDEATLAALNLGGNNQTSVNIPPAESAPMVVSAQPPPTGQNYDSNDMPPVTATTPNAGTTR